MQAVGIDLQQPPDALHQFFLGPTGRVSLPAQVLHEVHEVNGRHARQRDVEGIASFAEARHDIGDRQRDAPVLANPSHDSGLRKGGLQPIDELVHVARSAVLVGVHEKRLPRRLNVTSFLL